MGAAASIEVSKPVDASDIRSMGSLEVAAAEVKRLRADLGHLAKLAGIDVVVYDASDILLGDDEDFNRCIAEISHIRRLCSLNTNTSRRKTRQYSEANAPIVQAPTPSMDEKDLEDSSSSEEEGEDHE